MASEYKVNITIDDDSLKTLKADGFNLYAFRAVKGPQNGQPLVWYSRPATKIFASSNISWKVNYGAFVSLSDGKLNVQHTIPNGAEFDTREDKVINLGQKMIVDGSGNVSVTPDGVADTIAITNNNKNEAYVCGISEYKNNAFNPMCAFPLIQNNSDLITPIAQIVLMFATDTVRTATVVERSLGPGIVIDLTSSPERSVSYSVSGTWKADVNGYAENFASDAEMNPFLINPAR